MKIPEAIKRVPKWTWAAAGGAALLMLLLLRGRPAGEYLPATPSEEEQPPAGPDRFDELASSIQNLGQAVAAGQDRSEAVLSRVAQLNASTLNLIGDLRREVPRLGAAAADLSIPAGTPADAVGVNPARVASTVAVQEKELPFWSRQTNTIATERIRIRSDEPSASFTTRIAAAIEKWNSSAGDPKTQEEAHLAAQAARAEAAAAGVALPEWATRGKG